MPNRSGPTESHADRTDALFAQIASLSGNTELVETVRMVGVRLHAVRVQEVAILPDAAGEVRSLETAVTSRPTDLARLLMDYHEVRKRHSHQLLAGLEIGPAA